MAHQHASSSHCAVSRWDTLSLQIVFYAIMYSMTSSSMLIINKSAVLAFPYPNTALLLQLASTAAIAWAAGMLCRDMKIDALERSKITATLPLTAAFFMVLFTSMHALQYINVDTMVVLRTCTPITVAVGEWLYVNTALPSIRTWVTLSLVIITSAAAFSMHLAAISCTGALWLACWFLSITFYMVYSAHYVQTVQLTILGCIFYENFLSSVFCIPLAIATDLVIFITSQHKQEQHQQLGGIFSTLPHPAVVLVGASCIMGVSMSWCGWSLRQHITALSYTALGVGNKLLTVLINAHVWENHRSPISQALLMAGILAGSFYQQQAKQDSISSPKYSKLGSKGSVHRSHSNSGTTISKLWASMLAALGSIAMLVWIGFSLGRLLDTSQSAPMQGIHARPLWAQELHQLRETTFRTANNAQQLAYRNATGSHGSVFSMESNTAVPAGASDAGVTTAVHSAAAAALQQDDLVRLWNAATKPIKVVLMTSVFWSVNNKNTQNCSLDGVPLNCSFTSQATKENLKTADVLYYHAPSFSGAPRPKAFPEQLRLVISLESTAYYTSLDDPQYMCQFDAEMSYRRCAQITNWYSLEAFDKLFKTPLVPFVEKQHAIAYVNSNCAAKSGRSHIVRAMIALGVDAKVPVHSFGRCDNNKAWPGKQTKQQVFQKYKFCIAMENSIAQDYVTEKVWDGLSAGCVPIYMGSRSIRDYVPDRQGIIIYDPHGGGNASTPEELDTLLHSIGSNQAKYEEMVAWKAREVQDQPSPLFKHLWSVRHLTGECMLCQFVARHRASPQPRYTTCLFNHTWMAGASQRVMPDAYTEQGGLYSTASEIVSLQQQQQQQQL